MRLIETPNADAARSGEICVATAATGWRPEALRDSTSRESFLRPTFLADRVKERLAELGIKKWRTDTVLVEELLLLVSPEFLRDGDERNPPNPDKIRRAREAKLEYLQATYGKNLIAFVDHSDEHNYHGMAFVVPAMLRTSKRRGRPRKIEIGIQRDAEPKKEWRLCAKRMFSRAACSRAQDEFAASCRRHSLDVRRGVRGSRTPHLEMRAHLALVQSPVEPIPFVEVPEPGGIFETKRAYAEQVKTALDKQVEKANAQLAQYFAKAVELDRVSCAQKSYQQAAADAEAKVCRLEEKVVQLENENAELKAAAKANADKVRDIPLRRVVDALGYQAIEGSARDFNTPRGVLQLTDRAFVFGGTNCRGRNAIDLVKAAAQCDFTAAVRWLSGAFPEQVGGAAAAYLAAETDAVIRGAASAGPLRVAEQIELFAPACPHLWPGAMELVRSTIGTAVAEAENAKAAGLLNATKAGALRVNLSLPEEANWLSGAALINPAGLSTLQVVGTGCAVLRPEQKPAKVTFAENLAEALSLGQLDKSRRSILVPFGREMPAAFWAWVLEHVKRVDLAAARGRLDWIVSGAEAAFAKSGRLFDGLLDALFTHVQPLAGAWANELKVQADAAKPAGVRSIRLPS